MTFVTVQAGGGWDTHGDNFKQLKTKLLPKYDRGVAALVSDLHDRGLHDDVLVMAMGEFGRTPRINPQAGRDHWPGAMSILFAGGGLQMGQAIGTTNANGESRPASPPRPAACCPRCTTFWGSITTTPSTTRPNGRCPSSAKASRSRI